jgi:hypothetical protein
MAGMQRLEEPRGLDPFATELAEAAVGGSAREPTLLEEVGSTVHHYADWMVGTGAPPAPVTAAMGAEYAHQAQVQVDAAAVNAVSRRASELVEKGKESEALDALVALPPDAQGRALEALGHEQFSLLLGGMSDKDRRRLRPLIDATHDPSRKLALWGQGHLGESAAEIEEYQTAVAKGPRADRGANEDRLAAARGTRGEVANETAFLQAEIERRGVAGNPVSEAEVQALIDRKRLERMIERRHAVNLTSDLDGTSDVLSPEKRGSRSTWSQPELEMLNQTLDRLPAAHVRDNPKLHELRREQGRYAQNANGTYTAVAAADASHAGTVRLFDAGARLGVKDDRSMESVLVHELGHEVGFASPAEMGTINGSVDWKSHEKGEVDAALAGDPVKAARMTANRFGAETMGARTYSRNIDRYSSFEENAMPRGPGWEYSRTSPDEQFAELYLHSVMSPDKVYQDLVTDPERSTKTLEEQHRRLADAEAWAKGNEAPMAQRQDLMIQRASALAQLEGARARQAALRQQRRVMREEVFGVDDQLIARHVADLRAGAGEGADQTEAEFRREATMLMTPQQLKGLHERLASKSLAP